VYQVQWKIRIHVQPALLFGFPGEESPSSPSSSYSTEGHAPRSDGKIPAVLHVRQIARTPNDRIGIAYGDDRNLSWAWLSRMGQFLRVALKFEQDARLTNCHSGNRNR
jgi:hypothetical protein